MEGTFYTIIRQFFKGETEEHSMEVKADKNEALQRYYNIIAADLADSTVTWNACYIIDSNGSMIKNEVFDHTVNEED